MTGKNDKWHGFDHKHNGFLKPVRNGDRVTSIGVFEQIIPFERQLREEGKISQKQTPPFLVKIAI